MAKKNNGKKNSSLFNDKLEEMFREYLGNISLGQKNNQVEMIPESEWTLHHPDAVKCGSDKFYADLTNEIQNELSKLNLPVNTPELAVLNCAMAYSAYLEDLVTGTGVWIAVKKLYKERYGSWLPFYDTSHSDYFMDDLNIEDLKILTWQVLCRLGQSKEMVYSPISKLVETFAQIGYEILIDNFDKAPQSRRAKDVIEKAFRSEDFYQLRNLGIWINADCILTAIPHIRIQIMDDSEEILERYRYLNISDDMAYYYASSKMSFLENVGLLGCPTNKILEQMALDYGYDKTARLLSTIEIRPQKTYNIKGEEDGYILLEDATRQTFRLDKSSANLDDEARKCKSYIATLVKFGELWQQNGMGMFSPDEAKFPSVVMLDEGKIGLNNDELEAIVKKTGHRIFYCKGFSDIGKILGLPVSVDTSEIMNDIENIVLMLSSSAGAVVVPNACGLFSDRSNPFYDGSLDREVIGRECLTLIGTGLIPDDIAEYIQEKHLMPHASINVSQGKAIGKRLVQENLRFLCNFYSVRPADI